MLDLLKKSKVILALVNIVFLIETMNLFVNTIFSLGGLGSDHIYFYLGITSAIVLLQVFILITQINYFDKIVVVILSLLNAVLNVIAFTLSLNPGFYVYTFVSFLIAIFISLFFIFRYIQIGENK